MIRRRRRRDQPVTVHADLTAPENEPYFEAYAHLSMQRDMVHDRRRTDAFAEAIARAVQPGDVVLDVGTGTGILAMLAARAGAAHVYAVDQSAVARLAASLVEQNGLADRVTVLHGQASELHLDHPVDLLISEWIGHFGFVEAMLDDVLIARDNNLAPGGRMLPEHIEVQLAPVDDAVSYSSYGPGFWRRPVHGLDLSSLEAAELAQGATERVRIDPGARLGDAQTLVALDLAVAQLDDPYVDGTVSWTVERDGVLSGFVGSFATRLAGGVVLDTGTDLPPTHWLQTYFPFWPRTVAEGDQIEVAYSLAPDEREPRSLRVDLTVADRTQSFLVH